MQRIEAASYQIVMHTHDELVCEVPIDFSSTEEFTQLMTRNPSWAPDLPIAAEPWSGQRYCK
jgi:DNA polymerase